MMQLLHESTAVVDVFLTPSTLGNPRPPGGDAAPRVQNRTQQHYQMANLACYPALALPNGFTSEGAPTSITFMAQPFGEAKLLTAAKAYQDATDFNEAQPPLEQS
jgi:Asp-tRNA(Asn)/Glu-tRNA(Gln) amidotransferase A subunit family amidase